MKADWAAVDDYIAEKLLREDVAFDDVLAFLPNVDCALLVLAAEESPVAEADICEYELAQRTNVLGTVLNKCRYAQEKYGY